MDLAFVNSVKIYGHPRVYNLEIIDTPGEVVYEPLGHAVHTEAPVMRRIEKRRYCKGNRAGQHTGHCTISTSIDIVQRNN